MPSSLLAPALTEASSDPVTLALNEASNLFLTGAGAKTSTVGLITIQFQGSDNAWSDVYALESPAHRTARLVGPVTFRVRRQAGGVGALAVGVDRY